MLSTATANRCEIAATGAPHGPAGAVLSVRVASIHPPRRSAKSFRRGTSGRGPTVNLVPPTFCGADS